eukprot:comp24259_c1_seq1/m.45003 comp24259_c1_seq1/g.45003  ORF comp24259_c1_seq1/g.45003 comp24259_c1_seq1/m.45003 type:complete len:553 (-) comp24259_c1_seq1:43-1701(-)
MEWFGGTTAEAVQRVQREKSVLLVYVKDGSEGSRQTDATFSDPQVVSAIRSAGFTCLSLTVNTPDANNFAQFYPVLIIPTVYFISPGGQIIDALAGPQNPDALCGKISSVMQSQPPRAPASPPSVPPVAVNSPQAAVQNAPQDDGGPPPLEDEGPPPLEDESFAQPAQQSGEVGGEGESGQLSLEERAARLREIMRQKREQKEREAKEKERQKEIERRQMGKAIAEQQRQREEAERKKIAEDIKKQREEEKAVRERIRAQIAEDRRNRLANQETPRAMENEAQQQVTQERIRSQMEERRSRLVGQDTPRANQNTVQEQTESEPIRSQEAEGGRKPLGGQDSSRANQNTAGERPATERPPATSANILYRLADGSTLRQQYPAETTLTEARNQLIAAVPGLGEGIRLLSGFPPQPFTPDQFNQSLAQLGLTPTGTIIVKPPRGTSTSLQPPMTAQWLLDLVMLPFTLLPLFLNPFYFLGWYKPPQPANSGTGEPPAKRARTENPAPGRGDGGQGNIPRGAAVRRVRGNVHGLGNEEQGDDDRTETWNGNSTTQQ